MVLSADPNKRLPASFSHTFREAGLNQGLPFEKSKKKDKIS
jgi:mediator of RNA polymerase II transcription subunit 17